MATNAQSSGNGGQQPQQQQQQQLALQVLCKECGKSHKGACRTPCNTCGKRHLGQCRMAVAGRGQPIPSITEEIPPRFGTNQEVVRYQERQAGYQQAIAEMRMQPAMGMGMGTGMGMNPGFAAQFPNPFNQQPYGVQPGQEYGGQQYGLQTQGYGNPIGGFQPLSVGNIYNVSGGIHYHASGSSRGRGSSNRGRGRGGKGGKSAQDESTKGDKPAGVEKPARKSRGQKRWEKMEAELKNAKVNSDLLKIATEAEQLPSGEKKATEEDLMVLDDKPIYTVQDLVEQVNLQPGKLDPVKQAGAIENMAWAVVKYANSELLLSLIDAAKRKGSSIVEEAMELDLFTTEIAERDLLEDFY